jgi:hypothetical protein
VHDPALGHIVGIPGVANAASEFAIDVAVSDSCEDLQCEDPL